MNDRLIYSKKIPHKVTLTKSMNGSELEKKLTSESPDNGQTKKILDAVKTMLSVLPRSEQLKIVDELNNTLQPIPVRQAGKVLATIVRLLPEQKNWKVSDVSEEVKALGVDASTKEIYNAMTYLTRRGHVRRVGYGRYTVNGAMVISEENLGLEPSRFED